MKTIILSAGKGERLLPLTKDRPKILVSLGDGTTLLSRQCDSLLERSVLGDILIGGGHCVEKIDDFIAASEQKSHLNVVYNPFYGISGPLVTLWVVLNKMDDTDFMFMNGDTIFSSAVYDRLQEILESDEEGIFLLCSRHNEKGNDDVGVLFGADGNIIKAGKNIKDTDCISAGLAIVKGDTLRKSFRSTLESISRTEDFLKYSKTWHSFLNDLADQGIAVKPIEVARSEWVEIDIHYELTALQNMIKDKVRHSQF